MFDHFGAAVVNGDGCGVRFSSRIRAAHDGGAVTEAERAFVEAMGRHFEAEGVPRIGGRIFAFLLLQDTPCSLDDMAEQLEVSKASASTNARLLEDWALIDKTSIPGDRRDYYQAAADQSRPFEFRLARLREYAALLGQGHAAAASPAAAHRLASMAGFTRESLGLLESLLARMRASGQG